jgi:hypothetical protein
MMVNIAPHSFIREVKKAKTDFVYLKSDFSGTEKYGRYKHYKPSHICT